MVTQMRRILSSLAFLGFAIPTFAQVKPQQELKEAKPEKVDTVVYQRLRYRYIGPEGNRVTSVAGVPGDVNTYYAGAASGGLFKSSDGGIHWAPVFDNQPVSSVGALAVATSDPNVVYAGTGEPFTRSNISVGWGLFKSTDAGKTWARAGLENTGRISRIVVHPTNPDLVYAAALGYLYGPQQERGIYRSADGGKSWDRVLFVNDSTGASDIVMDPTNPRILYAGFWQVEIKTWGRFSGGAGSGIWKSTDGGSTWKRLTGPGMPTKTVGKVGLGISKANPSRIYALIETGDGVPTPEGKPTDSGRLFRSDDAGDNWQMVNADRQVAGRTHYYNRMGVSPDNPDEAYFLTSNWAKTLDGGRTIIDPPFTEYPGGDHHDIWIDPTNGNRMVVSHDGGVSVSINRGKSWIQTQLPLAQMYHATIDNRIPYNVYGNRQDGPSAMVPSNSRAGDFFFAGVEFPSISRGHSESVGGGESGWAIPDTVDGNLVWSSGSGSGTIGGIVTKYDRRTKLVHNVEIWPQSTVGWPADSLKYRFVWTAPVALSSHDHNVLYVGSQYVHMTNNGGKSWKEISPDLTRNDKSRQRISGGLTPDNIGVEYAGVVFAIGESPLDPKLLWVGSNDGLVHVTRDGGATWTNVTNNIPGLLNWGTISNIEPSRYDAGTAYLTVDGHQVNNRDPWVYKTTDFGRTWRLITAGLAKTPLSYAHVVREDPVRRGLLYLGTEGGLYVSFNDGESWQGLQNNLPRAPVYWIVVQPHFSDLVVATYGRGFWILDDITPLRTVDGVLAKETHLFAPRIAYRLHNTEQPFSVAYDPSAGFSPPYGTPINFYLKTGSDSTVKDSAGTRTVQKDSVSITISDATGAVVRTLKAPRNAGINRLWWNLRGDLTRQAKIRTSPEYAPWFSVSLEGRNAPTVGRIGVLVPPGTYTVRIAGTAESQRLVLRKDPNNNAGDAELAENVALSKQIASDLDGAATMINSLENVRGQLAALKATVADDSTRKDLLSVSDSLDMKLRTVERKLFQTRATGRGQDILRWPQRISEQLQYLAGEIDENDYAPTESQRQVSQVLRDQLAAVRAEYDRVMQRDVAAFNAMLQQRKVPNVIVSER
jgi:photosystem II stability/assembly factor-like uncharacterized protein